VRNILSKGVNSVSKPIIDTEECTGCGICIDSCPNEVLRLDDDLAKIANGANCDGCGTCAEECPMGCLEVETDE